MDKQDADVYRLPMLDRHGPVPLYQQIAALIARDIRGGHRGLARRIPSESEMCSRFGVARGTARRAVAHLRDTGLAFTVPQRGTYASPTPTPEVSH